MRGETRHLREIAHGGLGRVELPVGVGGEAGGRVPRQIGTDSGETLRIPQLMHGLEALDRVGEHEAHGGEAEHGEGVFAPVHLVIGIDAAELVDEPLDGTQNRIKPGALAFEHSRQIDAHRTT